MSRGAPAPRQGCGHGPTRRPDRAVGKRPTRRGGPFLLGTSILALVAGLGPVRAQDAGLVPPRSPGIAGLSAADFVTPEYLADYGLAQMNAATAYARGYTGAGILVGVYDSGIDPGHPEFAGRISPASRNFFIAPGQAIPPGYITDTDSHGTHVSGTIAAARNGTGMMGVAFDSTILTLYTLPSAAYSATRPGIKVDDAAPIDYAREQGVRVFNGSYGPTLPNPADNGPNYQILTKYTFGTDALQEYAAMKRAADAGMLIVMAAGNDRQVQPTVSINPSGAALYPFIKPSNANSGIYEFRNADGTLIDASRIDFSGVAGSIVSVVAVDRNNRIGSFSNWCGVTADWCIASAGVDVYSTGLRDMGRTYFTESGTSMAAPHVSGAAAVLMQAFPFLSAPQIAQTMFTTATPIGPREIYGWGLLNLGKAIDGPGQFTASWTVDTQGYFGRFANDISGIGGLTKTGAGTLELAGTNSYRGGTTINGGRLAVSRDANLGAANGGLAFGGGTLQVTADGFASARAVTLNGTGTLQIDTGRSTLTGVVADGAAGAGSLTKTGPGTLALTAANTFTGATTIAAGTLALAGAGSLATSSGVQVSASFDVSGVSGGTTAVQTLSGAGAVLLGGTTLTVTNGSTAFAGSIGGAGGLQVAGGTLALTGTSSYAGATTVTGGATLMAGSSAALGNGAAGNTMVLDNGTLRALGDIASPASRAVSLPGAGTLDSNGNTLSIAGTISGPGALTKAGAGTLALSGQNTFSGGTTVTAGLLALSASGGLASPVAVSAAGQLTSAGTLSGGLTNAGTAAITGGGVAGGVANSGLLTSAGALSGGLTNAGVVTLSAGRVDGGVANAGSVTVAGPVASDGAFGNAAGASLAVTGAGAYSLAGLLTNAGSVTVAGGGLLAALGGIANTGFLDLGGGALFTAALSGSDPRAVLTNAALTVGDARSSAYAGAIVDGSGVSSLTKTGTGTLTLSGASSYTGPTAIVGGTLSVNGSITSAVSVGSDGRLRGTGLIAAPVVVAGILAPGNSPGTLTVAGPVSFAGGSTFSIDIDGLGTGTGAGNYARLLAVGATGSVAAGGTLQPVLRGITGSATNGFTPALGQRFGVLAAAAGLTGSFAGLAQPSAGLPASARFDALYGTNALDLVVTPSAYGNLAANGLAQGGNARAVGAAIDGARPLAGTRPDPARQPFYDALYASAPGQLGTSLSSLSGQVYGDALVSDLAARRMLADTIDRHMRLGEGGVSLKAAESGGRSASAIFEMRNGAGGAQRPLAVGEGRIWADGIYGFGSRDGDRAASGARFDAGGAVAGLDYRLGADTAVGGAFSYLRNTGNPVQGASAFAPGRFTADGFGGTAYGSTRFGHLELRGQAGVSYATSRIERLSALGSLVRRGAANPDGLDASVAGFAGYRVRTGLPLDLIPEAGFAYDALTRSASRERGGLPIAAGGVRTADLDAARTLVGGRLAGAALDEAGAIRFEARGYWAHELADTTALIRSDIFGTAFATRTSRPGRDEAVLGAGLSGTVVPGVRVAAGYTGTVYGRATVQAFTAGVDVAW